MTVIKLLEGRLKSFRRRRFYGKATWTSNWIASGLPTIEQEALANSDTRDAEPAVE